MRTLIIGGTGLISTAISRFLLERGDEVIHYNRGLSQSRLETEVTTILGDRQDYPAFEAQMAPAGPFDCVIDMICFLPEEAHSAIRAFKGRAGQFIFCSTVDVYNRPAGRYPIREDEPRDSPASLYGQNKAKAENVLLAAHKRGDFPVTIIRPAHTYGEGGRILHTFGWETAYLDRIRQGKPIVVHGDGTALWASCHIDDVGRAFVAAVGNSRTFGQAYHVTGEQWQMWNDYHRGVAEAMAAPEPALVHIPTDLLLRLTPKARICAENFQFNNIFDNSAARSDLNFDYTIPWVEGVRRTVAWLEAENKIEDSDRDLHDDQIINLWHRFSKEMVQILRDGT